MTDIAPVGPPLRSEEERVRRILDRDLRERAVSVVWTGERDDPPDAWVALDGVRHAVEITSIDFTSDKGRSARAEYARWQAAVNQPVDTINASGLVHGFWILDVPMIDDVRTARDRLRSALDGLFRSDRPGRECELRIELDDAGSAARLRRVDGAGERCGVHPRAEGFADHNPSDTTELQAKLPEAVARKAARMNERRVPHPWILAIADRVGEAYEKWPELLPDEAKHFSAVYRIGYRRAVLVREASGYPGA